MSGRDVYLELGYHQKPVNKPASTKAEPANAIAVADEPMPENKSFLALEGASYSAPRPLSEVPSETAETNDYMVGLLLILFVLLIGLAGGFFGRAWVSPAPQGASDLSILSTQVNTMDGSKAVVFGSADSDEVLAIEPLANGDAMMLVKTHYGPDAGDTETRLMRMNAAASSSADSQLTELGSLQGTGLHLTRLGDGSLITLSAHESEIIVSRISESGSTEWTLEFASNPLDRAEVAIAPDANGLVFMAPSADRAFSQVVSISSEGNIAWQKQFDRPRGWQQAFISLDKHGQTYAVLGAASADPIFGDQNIAIINANGEMLRQRLLTLEAEEAISGTSARPDGGVTYFVSGPAPRLIYMDITGQPVGTVDLPHMQYFSDVRLQTLENGDTLIASTYALMGDRVDLVLEQKTADGLLLGQSSQTLPVGAKLDDLMQIDDRTYLAVGSARSERYRPTDLFMQRVTFTPLDREMASLASARFNRSTLASTADTSPLDVTVENTAASIDPESSESLPIIASLTLAPTDEAPSEISNAASETASEATEIEAAAEATSAPEGSDDVAEVSSAEANSSEEGPETLLDVELGVEFVVDENAAALSRFFDESIVTQCRFTCLDTSTSSSFPMTGHFLPALLSNAADASALHARVCQSAELAPDFQTRPVCGIN